jgi:hypothetical protein
MLKLARFSAKMSALILPRVDPVSRSSRAYVKTLSQKELKGHMLEMIKRSNSEIKHEFLRIEIEMLTQSLQY